MAKQQGHPSIIAHGSDGHRGLLGIDQCEDEKRKAVLGQLNSLSDEYLGSAAQ